VAVHGNAANSGLFQVNLSCTPHCSATEGNDRCANAQLITTQLNDGLQVLVTDNNDCSYVDGPNACSGTEPVVGNWYRFNTGPNSIHRLYTVDNSDGPYTASTVNYALYSGACQDLVAGGEVICGTNVGGSFVALPALTTNTEYRLLIYNNGSVSQRGSYGFWIDRPPAYDADVTAVLNPTGPLCNGTVAPEVTLLNNGSQTLTSVTLSVFIDANPVPLATFPVTVNLAFGASQNITLPFINIPSGPHTITVSASNPSGQPDEIPANDGATESYQLTGFTVFVSVTTDANPGQTSWQLFDAFFFPVASSGTLTANSTNETNVCLQPTFGNCFYFFLFDAAGDGLAAPGRWELRDGAQRVILKDNGQFGNQSPAISPQSASYFAHEFCVPLGPSAPLQTECDLFSNLLNNKVFCNTVPGVSQYQFEFSNPNAGFIRRIALPRNWVQFSEMQFTNPLSLGVTYFCRVRVDRGAAGFSDDYYGAGCEMALASVQPTCTELISTPGPSFSCGVTKTFGGSDKIFAVPVNGATQYRFRFTGGLIDPDGPTGPQAPTVQARNITRSSYVNILNWSTFTLVSGQTYNVQVEVLVAGVWTGFCGQTCTVTILNAPSQGGRAVETSIEEAGTGVSLWPNPVRDGQVNLRIEGLSGELQPIDVDVYDAFGKRVLSERFETEATLFTQTLDLSTEIAAGVYMVQITVDGVQTVERLNVVR